MSGQAHRRLGRDPLDPDIEITLAALVGSIGHLLAIARHGRIAVESGIERDLLHIVMARSKRKTLHPKHPAEGKAAEHERREYPRQQFFRAPGPLRYAVHRFRLVLRGKFFE